MRAIRRLLTLAILGLTLVAGIVTVRIWQQGETDDARASDAIVVLGAAQYDGRPSPVLQARVDHAVALFRAGLAPLLIVTGGGAEGDRSTEAAAARDYAMALGVPGDAIVLEDAGRTTLASLRSVAAIMAERGLRSAVFVSDRMHMFRVLQMASDLGIEARGSPTTTSPTDATLPARLDALAHELAALVVYVLGPVVSAPALTP